jgi:hypothetical protein
MHGACWITKATNIHSEYVILITLPLQYGCTEALQNYVMFTFPVFFEISLRFEVECDWAIALAVSTLA